jgi:hypothetical protein
MTSTSSKFISIRLSMAWSHIVDNLKMEACEKHIEHNFIHVVIMHRSFLPTCSSQPSQARRITSSSAKPSGGDKWCLIAGKLALHRSVRMPLMKASHDGGVNRNRTA